ncbi:unnamed protein product [Caenorhabditis bovis]|uniref:Flavin-containing monooxygenase n=1 Tax=Caenorhabditis bovis TaxID=2654633 RepID=A0A8S1F1Z7_9PELO|nr:unnamed protein product [Caenorhabditis bovis]
MATGKKRLLIVGAGASGLPSLRHALMHPEIEVVCLEGSGEIGGLWRYKPEETQLSSVMKSTVINTSKEMTAYSDFPPESRMANFMHNREMLRYLSMYADHFDLRAHIRFNHKVEAIERNDDYEATGKWRVAYVDDKGGRHTEVFDGVMLCHGHHTIPHWPAKFPGQDEFKGNIIHSHSYKDHRGYEDRVVVVVGVGNSGGDVAVELSRIAKQVYLVTRRGTWVFNRIYDYGQPVDLALNRKFLTDIHRVLPEWVSNALMERKLNKRFDHNAYGLKPQHRVYGAHPTINDELPNRIACGTVRIKPNIAKFTEHGILFQDGTKLEHVDDVIMSTGYSFECNLVENGKLIEVVDNKVDLYKYMLPIVTADHNTLSIIGCVQPFGSIMPLSELQARVFLEEFTGKHVLPSKSEMIRDVETKREQMAKRFVASRRHTIQVDYVNYADELARLIGANVDLKRLLFNDPMLAYKVYFGPWVPYIFRLNGPNKWENARDAIMGVDERVSLGNTDGKEVKSEESNTLFYLFAFAFVLLLIIIVF